MAQPTKLTPTMLDRAIGHLFPSWGRDRLRARAQLHLAMNYDGASRGRRTFGWRAPSTSADAAAHEGGARTQLRNLARDFVRNRPFAARGISVITGNVVGTGIVPSVAHDDKARKADIDAVLRQHLGTTDFDAGGIHSMSSAQRVVMNSVVQDGEILVRRRWRVGPYGRALGLPFQVELLEADFLDPVKTSYGQNEVIDGVEYGPTGAVVAYHILRQHPGAISWRIGALDSVRVPASDIIHVFRPDRPGQSRGVSWFAPVMMTLGDISDYQEAEILKQKIAALLAGFITSDEDDSEVATDTDAEAEAMGLGEIAPGTMTELPPGKSVNFTDPPQVPAGYDGFMRQNLAAVAMGLGITYEALAGDLSNVNFSSARMGRMEMDKNIETWQQLVMIDRFCAGIERWVAEAWALTPSLGPVDFRLRWTAPRRALIDPTKEVPALIKEIEGGLNSRQRVQRQLGRDPDEIAREREEDAARDGAKQEQTNNTTGKEGGDA